MVLGDLDSYMEKNETWSPTYTTHKINLRWIKNLNISHNIIKVLEENIGRKISDIPWTNIFTVMSPQARDIKERINKWDLNKIKSFCMAKGNSIKIKREPTIWENIFANDTIDKVWPSKYIKNLHDSTLRKQKKNPIKKWAKDLNRHFSKEDIQSCLLYTSDAADDQSRV